MSSTKQIHNDTQLNVHWIVLKCFSFQNSNNAFVWINNNYGKSCYRQEIILMLKWICKLQQTMLLLVKTQCENKYYFQHNFYWRVYTNVSSQYHFRNHHQPWLIQMKWHRNNLIPTTKQMFCKMWETLFFFSQHCCYNDSIQLTHYHLQSNNNPNQPQKQFLLMLYKIMWYSGK